MDRIERIREMERCLDASRAAVDSLSEALDRYEAVRKDYKKLSDYYGSSRWMSDFEADEAGKLPKDLKRGVLSEDAVYDLLDEHRELVARMLKAAAKALEDDTV